MINMTGKVQIHGSAGDQARVSGLIRLLVPLLGLVFTAGILFGIVLPCPVQKSAWFVFILLAFILAGGILLLLYFSKRAAMYLKGARGEEITALRLAALPGGWIVFHAPEIAATDHIVIGPTGIFTVETKFWSGKVACRDGHILVNGNEPSRQPLEQARTSARLLSAYLSARTENLPEVVPLVCFASDNLMSPAAGVCNASDIVASLIERPVILTDAQVELIASRL